MNPYSRFQVISGIVSGALVLAGFGLLAKNFIGDTFTTQTALTLTGLIAVAVTIWYALNANLLPLVLRHQGLRQAVLGGQHIEGTWLQAEKSADGNRVAVIDIRPGAHGAFTLTGYAMDENFDVVSNLSIEFSRLEWPTMSFKYRNTLVDFDDPHRDGFGEIQFELNNGRPRRFNGYCKLTNGQGRFGIEGVRLMEEDDLEMLVSLEGREELVEKYWELFFERDERREVRVAERKARRDARQAARKARVDAALTEAEAGALDLRKKVESAFTSEDDEVELRPTRRRVS